LHEVGQRNPAFIAPVKIPPPDGFSQQWYFLNRRIQQGQTTTEAFRDAIEEFQSILLSYSGQCVNPVFHLYASQFREFLTDNEKSRFNSFQQQYVIFLGNYVRFVERLNHEFDSVGKFPTGIPSPTPL